MTPPLTPETLANIFALLCTCGDKEGVNSKVASANVVNSVGSYVSRAEEKVSVGAKAVIAKFGS